MSVIVLARDVSKTFFQDLDSAPQDHDFYAVSDHSARCNINISRLCYDVSVRLSVHLSVTDVHWRIIANFGFKFRSKFTAHCGHGEV